MALATAPSFASFDITSRTEGRDVDSVLWDYMFAKSRLLEVIGVGPKINQQRYEWVNLGGPTITVTEASSGSTTIDSSGAVANNVLVVGSGQGAKLMEGALLMNVSRATPVDDATTSGLYRNELLEVTAISTDTLTVVRDAGGFSHATPASRTGSTLHTLGDTYRVVAVPHQEGSVASLDPNKYVAQTILENYSAIQAIKFQVTGSQMARDMEVVASDLERQYAREMIQLKNELAQMVFYGFGATTAVGSDTVIRQCKGVLDFMADNLVSTNAMVDYATTTLTADAIKALFLKLWNNGADPSEDYKIVTSGASQQVISSWENDKVRTTWQEGRVGRYITEFVSDLGFTAEVIADPMITKSDLFIINPSKIKVIPFRPFQKMEWGLDTSAPNGDDVYYSRVIGEHTVQVVDPGVGHAAIVTLGW